MHTRTKARLNWDLKIFELKHSETIFEEKYERKKTHTHKFTQQINGSTQNIHIDTLTNTITNTHLRTKYHRETEKEQMS